MNEYCIIFPKYKNDIFIHFWKKFELLAQKLKNITIQNEEENIRLCYSIKKNNKGVFEQINKLLSESIVLNYKYKFMTDNLILPSDYKHYKDALCKSLAVFDRSTDILDVLSLLEINTTLNVDSFYAFKLAGLRARWKEITDLFIDNMSNMIYSNSFVELIRYLIMTTESCGEDVFVYSFNDIIYLRNKDGSNLSEPIIVQEDYLPAVVSELILIAPTNIYLKYDLTTKNELTDIIIDLFAEKVVVNTWQISCA